MDSWSSQLHSGTTHSSIKVVTTLDNSGIGTKECIEPAKQSRPTHWLTEQDWENDVGAIIMRGAAATANTTPPRHPPAPLWPLRKAQVTDERAM